MDEQKAEAGHDVNYSQEAVPPRWQRQGAWTAMMVLVGFTFFTPSMTAGGSMGVNMNERDFFLALFFGNVFLAAYSAALAFIGQRTGLSLDLLARRALGEKGACLASAIIGITQMGWVGVGLAMFALPVSSLTSLPLWLVIGVFGIAMTFTVWKGLGAVALLGATALPLMAALGGYSVYAGVTATSGFANVFNAVGSMSVASGMALVVGAFISGATVTPNFTRFSKSSRGAVISTAIAFGVGNFFMFLFGAVGGAVAGKADIFDILIMQGLTLPAIVVLGLSIWTTNNTGLYTVGLSFSNISKAPMKLCILLGGAVATLCAMWLYENFVGYLIFLSGVIPPVGAVIALHYVLHREDYAADAPLTHLRFESLAAIVGGVAVGMLVKQGIGPCNALAAAALIYLVGDQLQRRRALVVASR